MTLISETISVTLEADHDIYEREVHTVINTSLIFYIREPTTLATCMAYNFRV